MNYKPLILTEAQIDGVDPASVAFLVLIEHFGGLKGMDFTEHIRHVAQHWRAVYTVYCLEGEVNNGGFHQFFWNSDGALNKETLEDLRLISAHPFVFLFEEALDDYKRHDYVGDKRDSLNGMEGFLEAYKEKRMEMLDTAFYKAPKTIAMYLADYIRTNRKMYLGDR